MSRFTRRLLDVLYVRPCVFCGRLVNIRNNINLCDKCRSKINHVGQTIFTADRITISVLPHKGFPRRAMNRFKFKNKRYYGYTFAKLIYERLLKCDWIDKVDCVTAVPMGKRDRLYNQAAVIGVQVAENLNVPFAENALKKVKDNPPFYKLSRRQRIALIKGTFKANDISSFAGKNVLLIDDIYTTGATSGECRHVLMVNGASKVYCATACYTTFEKKSNKI